MEKLSPRQEKILAFIASFIKEKDYPPSVRDIVRGCSISSSSVAQYHLNVLERKGHIRRDPEVSRGIGLVRKGGDSARVPLLGTIAAGQPIPVPSPDAWTTRPEETLEVPRYLTGGKDRLYALRVKGVSMIDALIDDGDIVLMEQADTADDGQMVAAWLKQEQVVTLKKLYREPERIRLEPANAMMKSIYCRPENVDIQGKVVGILRKL